MSVYPRDYVDSYFEGNEDWIEDEMLERGREMRADGVDVVASDLVDSYAHAQAVEDIKYDILSDIEWELDDLVQGRLDEVADRVVDYLLNNPESEED